MLLRKATRFLIRTQDATINRFLLGNRRTFAAHTWTYLDYYATEFPLHVVEEQQCETVYELRKEIALINQFRNPGTLEVYESKGGRKLSSEEKPPVKPKDDPLYITRKLTEREEEEEVKKQAELFLETLMNTELEEVPIPDDLPTHLVPDPIYLLKNIPGILYNTNRSIFLRSSMKEVLDLADEMVESWPKRRPVCIVGSPGIGKSMTFPYLIQKLLKAGKTVTFLRRTTQEASFFIQMIPGNECKSPTVKVFPETSQINHLPTMNDPEAYLLVDCGATMDSCNWCESIRAKLIINASPDSRHWGETEFAKVRSSEGLVGGRLLYVPSYSLAELLVVVPQLKPDATYASIENDYYTCGGSHRLLIGENDQTRYQLNLRRGMNDGISNDNVMKICSGNYPFLPSNIDGLCSAFLGLEPQSIDPGNDERR